MMRSAVLPIIALLTGFTASGQEFDHGAFDHCGSAHHGFQPPTPPNLDSVAVPGLTLQAPIYGGSGCPQGSVSAVLSPDQKSLSILFDSYLAHAGGATGLVSAQTECTVKIPISVPAGYQAQIVQIDYRGFNNVPAGAFSSVTANFGYDSWNGQPLPLRRFGRTMQFNGPLADDFILSSQIMGPPLSPCGQSFTLTSQSVIQIATRTGADASSQIDSLDAVAAPVRLALRWQRCGWGPGGPGGWHPGPPPPHGFGGGGWHSGPGR